jgi:hypothetical protein
MKFKSIGKALAAKQYAEKQGEYFYMRHNGLSIRIFSIEKHANCVLINKQTNQYIITMDVFKAVSFHSN